MKISEIKYMRSYRRLGCLAPLNCCRKLLSAGILPAMIAVLALGLMAPKAAAQREQNNIYLFDCTGSMQKKQLWEPAKKALDTTIEAQSDLTESRFHVLPFGDNVYETISFGATGYSGKKKTIEEAEDKYIRQAKYTNICDALDKGFALCDPAKENRIYLLTDGEPNRGGSAEDVAAKIDRWCANHKNARLFYVALAPDAVNPVIEAAVNRCPDAYMVKCVSNLIPQIADFPTTEIHGNIEELDKIHPLRFSLPGKKPMTAECSDPLFNVEVVGGGSDNRQLALKITPRRQLDKAELHSLLTPQVDADHNYCFSVKLIPGDKSFFIANSEVHVSVADHIQSNLTLLGGSNEETDLGKARWYPSFLWADAAPDGEVAVDLAPQFTNAAEDAEVQMSVQPGEGESRDFRVFFNDEEIAADGDFAIRPGAPALLRIVFNNDAKEGKRYFALQREDSQGVDLINGQPTDSVDEIPLRGKYAVNWNPLKTWLVIIAIALVGLLLLWLLVLKRFFYPTIKAGRIALMGPGNYMSAKKIKGMRRVVYTSKRRSQNLLSRIFVGQDLFIRAEHFTPEIELTAGSRKRVRLRSVKDPRKSATQQPEWVFSPTSTLSPYDKTTASLRDPSNPAAPPVSFIAELS